MQIQRIQTLWLLIATILMGVFVFMPFGTFEVVADGQEDIVTLTTCKEFGVLVPAAVAAILLLIDIFMYKNLPSQRSVLVIGIILTLCTICTVCFTLFKGLEGYEPHFSWFDIMVPAALIFELLAMKGINHDQKLLASYNRLR
jgi:hypothetical protein